MNFDGNMVALITPFRDGELDEPALRALVDRVIEGGVSGVIPCGTTGESPTLSHEEHDRVVALTVDAVGGRVPVIAGAGSNSTKEAVRLTKAAHKAGANAVLSVNPYYNKPTQGGMRQHFTAIADASPLPVVLYNIPGRCGIELTLETVIQLAEHDNIQAIKEATGKVENASTLSTATNLAVLSGDDSLTVPLMALGAVGVISVISNLEPAAMTRLVRAALDNDFVTARREHDRLYPLMQGMFFESNPAPVKACMASRDWIKNELRPPLCPVSTSTMSRLEELQNSFLELGAT